MALIKNYSWVYVGFGSFSFYHKADRLLLFSVMVEDPSSPNLPPPSIPPSFPYRAALSQSKRVSHSVPVVARDYDPQPQ